MEKEVDQESTPISADCSQDGPLEPTTAHLSPSPERQSLTDGRKKGGHCSSSVDQISRWQPLLSLAYFWQMGGAGASRASKPTRQKCTFPPLPRFAGFSCGTPYFPRVSVVFCVCQCVSGMVRKCGLPRLRTREIGSPNPRLTQSLSPLSRGRLRCRCAVHTAFGLPHFAFAAPESSGTKGRGRSSRLRASLVESSRSTVR